jgi:hypothetical protein
MISRSQSIVSRALCTRHQQDDCTSRRVWCGPTGLAPAPGNPVRIRDRLPTAPKLGKRAKETIRS